MISDYRIESAVNPPNPLQASSPYLVASTTHDLCWCPNVQDSTACSRRVVRIELAVEAADRLHWPGNYALENIGPIVPDRCLIEQSHGTPSICMSEYGLTRLWGSNRRYFQTTVAAATEASRSIKPSCAAVAAAAECCFLGPESHKALGWDGLSGAQSISDSLSQAFNAT